MAKKAPAEWVDDDLKRFRRELPEQIAAFQRLLALHAERQVHGRGAFNALRVTITRPDGSEHIRLVAVDQEHRDDLDLSLDRVLKELENLTGSPQRAQHALLALLSERLLPDQTRNGDLGNHTMGTRDEGRQGGLYG